MEQDNYWLLKNKEKILIKIIDWCQKNNQKVENINFTTLIEALSSSSCRRSVSQG